MKQLLIDCNNSAIYDELLQNTQRSYTHEKHDYFEVWSKEIYSKLSFLHDKFCSISC